MEKEPKIKKDQQIVLEFPEQEDETENIPDQGEVKKQKEIDEEKRKKQEELDELYAPGKDEPWWNK